MSSRANFTYPKDVQKTASDVAALLRQSGYGVDRDGRAQLLTARDLQSPRNAKTRRAFPDAIHGIVTVPAGRSRNKTSVMSARGALVMPPDKATSQAITKILERAGYKVADWDMRRSWEITLSVTDKNWGDAEERARAERAHQRSQQAYQGLSHALEAIHGAETAEERNTLAESAVKAYGLTLDKTIGIIAQRGMDSEETRQAAILAMPALKPHLAGHAARPWKDILREVLAAGANHDLIRAVIGELPHGGFAFQACARMAAGGPRERAQAAIRIAGNALLAAEALDVTEAVETAARALAMGVPEKLRITGARRGGGRRQFGEGPALLLKTLSYGDPDEVYAELEGALGKSDGTLDDALTKAMLPGYQKIVLSALAVIAWSHLEWKRKASLKEAIEEAARYAA